MANKLETPFDTRYFDKYEEADPWWVPDYELKNQIKRKEDNFDDYLFFDFTLKNDVLKEKREFIENYFENLKNIEKSKKMYKKQKKPNIVKEDSLVSFVFSGDLESVRLKKAGSSKKNSRKKTTCDISRKTKDEAKSLTPFRMTKKTLSKKTVVAKNVNKKNKKLLLNKHTSKEMFKTYMIKSNKDEFKKISIPKYYRTKAGKSKNKKKQEDRESELINYNFFKTTIHDENHKESYNRVKSPKMINKINLGERSVKNKFIINIKNFQSPPKKKNFLLDFLNTNVYKKKKQSIVSSQKRLKTETGANKTAKLKGVAGKKLRLKSPLAKTLLESKQNRYK